MIEKGGYIKVEDPTKLPAIYIKESRIISQSFVQEKPLFSPRDPVTDDRLPDEVVESFRGKATALRGDVLYAPYAADYLF